MNKTFSHVKGILITGLFLLFGYFIGTHSTDPQNHPEPFSMLTTDKLIQLLGAPDHKIIEHNKNETWCYGPMAVLLTGSTIPEMKVSSIVFYKLKSATFEEISMHQESN